LYILPIKEYVEACDEVEPLELLPPPSVEVVVGFQGGKKTEIPIIYEDESNNNLLILA